MAKQEPREASTALLQVDEALEVLEETDVRLVKDERSAFLAKQAEHDEFALSYQRKAESVRGDDAKKLKKSEPSRLRLPEHHVPQCEAKRYIPPGTAIWQGRTIICWNGHCPPYRRCSGTLAEYGNSELALRVVLKMLWRQYLKKNGKTERDCTVEGLL